MNKRKAIRILEEQRQKVLSPDHPNNDEWIFETTSYIKDFFGFESTEYSRIAQFNWFLRFEIGTPIEDKRIALRENKERIIYFLENCKRTLKNKGIYKPQNRNWFSDKGNDFFIKTAIGLIIFGIGIGYWIKEFEFFSTLLKEKSFNISDTKSLKSLPFDITKKPTDNIEENKSENN